MTHPPAAHRASEGVEPPCTFGSNAGPTAPDHERIYLEPGNGDPDNGRLWCRDDVWAGDENYEGMEATAYVRADLSLADAVRLVEENLRLREALMALANGECGSTMADARQVARAALTPTAAEPGREGG